MFPIKSFDDFISLLYNGIGKKPNTTKIKPSEINKEIIKHSGGIVKGGFQNGRFRNKS